jgi:hypothetical protein
MQSTPKYSALQLLFISMPFTLLAYVHHSQFMTRGLLLTNFGHFSNFSSYNFYSTAPTTIKPTYSTFALPTPFTCMLFPYTSSLFHSQFMRRGALLTNFGQFPNFSSYNSYITAPTINQPTFPTSTTPSLFTYMLFSYTSYVFNSQFMTRGALLTISGHFRIPVFTTSPIQYQPSSNQFFQH